MSKTKRWLDELPLESCERELLLIGKSARPAAGAVDANWQALCLALSSTVAATGVATSSIAGNAVSTQVGSSLVAGKVAGAGLWVASAKSLALGLTLGFTVLGAGAVAEHLSVNSKATATGAKPNLARPARRPSASSPSVQLAAEPGSVAVSPTASVGATPASAARHEELAASNPAQTQANAPAVASAAPALPAASLAQQARELAELKRLIDSGATTEALRRLDTNFSAGAGSALSEERDALHVQALDRAQRRDEARSFARRFLVRYPHSPYFETMRRLLAEE